MVFAELATIGRRGRLWGEGSHLTNRHALSGAKATDCWIFVLRCESGPTHKRDGGDVSSLQLVSKRGVC